MKKYISILALTFGLGTFAQDIEFKAANFKDNKDEFKVAN